MRQPQSCRAPRHGPLLAAVSMASVLVGPLLGTGVACADPVPLPTVDFALSADVRRGGSMDVAHSQGKLRVEMTKPNVPGSIVGIIDLRARRMVVRTPNLPNMAVEIELPPEFALGILNGSGLRVGESQAAGEPCDLWKIDTPAGGAAGGAAGGTAMGASVGPTTACITSDGIALRTEVEVQGKKQTVFEALKLTRAPQDPKLFQLPAGVQVMKVPKGKIGSALGLPGLGGPLLDLVPKP